MINNQSAVDSLDSQALLNKMVFEYLRDKKRKRVWRWVWRILLLLIVCVAFYAYYQDNSEEMLSRSSPHAGLIDIKEGIFENQPASADNFSKSMEKAYENKSLKAVILRINSPGGSPVQADYMYNLIRFYRQKYPDVKTYAVCVDMCASAAYYVASAADEIYANPSSLVGSIGVLYNGFGFVDTMQKLGVTRRLQTAGRNKGFLDQFSPTDPVQQKTLQTMLDLIHQQFIDKVKEGRGSRLKIDDDTFSGLFWTGTQAKERGLIDGFASTGQLLRDVLKLDKVFDYTQKDNMFEQMAKNVGMSVANQLPTALGVRPGVQ